jgi:Glycerol-3-phosphate responsive antiterminator (mRNA-binding)
LIESERIRLPVVYVACDGRSDWAPPSALEAGLLLRDTDLPALIHRASQDGPPLAVDIDTVSGLDADQVAVAFVIQRLGIDVVLTRRPQLAAGAAALGGLGLLQVLGFDSTGLLHALVSHPRQPHVGTAMSPGLVLAHLLPEELGRLPRPILAYGLIYTPEAARSILLRADSVVVRPQIAEQMVSLPAAAIAAYRRSVPRPAT